MINFQYARANDVADAVRRRTEIVGVFVNEELDALVTLADEIGLTMVQLHGDEGARRKALQHGIDRGQQDRGAVATLDRVARSNRIAARRLSNLDEPLIAFTQHIGEHQDVLVGHAEREVRPLDLGHPGEHRVVAVGKEAADPVGVLRSPRLRHDGAGAVAEQVEPLEAEVLPDRFDIANRVFCDRERSRCSKG